MAAQPSKNEDSLADSADSPKLGVIGSILKFFGKSITAIAPNFKPFLVSAAAKPPVIEIGYGETTYFELGMVNISSGEFDVLYENDPQLLLFNDRLISFEILEYPENISKNSWYITFNPDIVDVTVGKEIKTNVSISLTSPPIASNAIQSGLLKIRVYDTWAMSNIWWPQGNFPGYETFPMKVLWLFSAIFLLRFGKYSGHLQTDYQDVDILIKVKPYHAVKLEALPLINLKPDEIVSIPISIQNLGNYNDTFDFRIVSEHNDIILSNPTSVTLAPGETSDTLIGVSVPPSVLDYGTIHNVKLQVYSIADPNTTIAERTIILETKGVFISEASILMLLLTTILIIIFIGFFIYIRRTSISQYCIKPNKPWEIPEEKKYLSELKKTDREKYNEILKMMRDEYQSSLLWYKSYCDYILRKRKKIKKNTANKKIKKKQKKRESIVLSKPKLKQTLVTKTKEEKVEPSKKEEKKFDPEEKHRQQILSKIRREQEKQKKKMREFFSSNNSRGMNKT